MEKAYDYRPERILLKDYEKRTARSVCGVLSAEKTALIKEKVSENVIIRMATHKEYGGVHAYPFGQNRTDFQKIIT